MQDFFFQIVLFLAGGFIGVAVPLLHEKHQKRIAGLFAILLIITALAWAGYELGFGLIPNPLAESNGNTITIE